MPKLDDMKLHTTGEGGVSPPAEEESGFPERLKLAMAGQSARAFARAIGKSDAVVRQYLSGESEPTRKVLLAIARVANVAVEWLVSGKGKMRANNASECVSHDTSFACVNYAKLEAVLVAVKEAIIHGNYNITPAQEAKIVSGIYELYLHSSLLPNTAVINLLEAINSRNT